MCHQPIQCWPQKAYLYRKFVWFWNHLEWIGSGRCTLFKMAGTTSDVSQYYTVPVFRTDCTHACSTLFSDPPTHTIPLTHCGLETPYGDIDLGQHWLRQWLVAWRHQVITWTNVDLSSVRSSCIHLMAISQEIHQSSMNKINMKITHLKFH